MFVPTKRIHWWLLVVFAVAWETLRNESVVGVRGPSLSDLPLVFIVEAVILIVVWWELERGSAWRKAVLAIQSVLVATGVIFYLWQKSWTGRVFSAAEATLQELKMGHLASQFREVVLTKDGLVFWCLVQTDLPLEKKKDASALIQSKLQEDLAKQFPSIKRVLATAI